MQGGGQDPLPAGRHGNLSPCLRPLLETPSTASGAPVLRPRFPPRLKLSSPHLSSDAGALPTAPRPVLCCKLLVRGVRAVVSSSATGTSLARRTGRAATLRVLVPRSGAAALPRRGDVTPPVGLRVTTGRGRSLVADAAGGLAEAGFETTRGLERLDGGVGQPCIGRDGARLGPGGSPAACPARRGVAPRRRRNELPGGVCGPCVSNAASCHSNAAGSIPHRAAAAVAPAGGRPAVICPRTRASRRSQRASIAVRCLRSLRERSAGLSWRQHARRSSAVPSAAAVRRTIQRRAAAEGRPRNRAKPGGSVSASNGCAALCTLA